jgi:hypothetical protein
MYVSDASYIDAKTGLPQPFSLVQISGMSLTQFAVLVKSATKKNTGNCDICIAMSVSSHINNIIVSFEWMVGRVLPVFPVNS